MFYFSAELLILLLLLITWQWNKLGGKYAQNLGTPYDIRFARFVHNVQYFKISKKEKNVKNIKWKHDSHRKVINYV